MMKQGMNDVWKQSRQMDENIAKMGNNKPHLLLEKYGYNKYNILVAGGMIGDQYNGSYEEYLKKFENFKDLNLPDLVYLAAIFLFAGMK